MCLHYKFPSLLLVVVGLHALGTPRGMPAKPPKLDMSKGRDQTNCGQVLWEHGNCKPWKAVCLGEGKLYFQKCVDRTHKFGKANGPGIYVQNQYWPSGIRVCHYPWKNISYINSNFCCTTSTWWKGLLGMTHERQWWQPSDSHGQEDGTNISFCNVVTMYAMEKISDW